MCDNSQRAAAAWCGYCYENLRRRANHSGHLGFRRPRRSVIHGEVNMPIDRPNGAGERPRGGDGADGGLFKQHFPLLWEYCTAESWSDGSPRVTASVLVFFEAGVFKCCLNDRASCRTGWSSGNTAEDALASIEGHLRANSMDWRKSKAPPAGRRA